MMDLPNLFSSTPKKDKLYLGLILTDQTVQGILWKIAGGEIKVVRSSEIIDIPSPDKTVVQTDLALQDLGELSENLNEVILGLDSTWVNTKGLVDEKKPLLKKLTEDLSLKPIGFVVFTEAIAQYLTAQNANLSTILVYFSKNKMSVSLIENGVLQKTESVGRSDQASSDLIEALARFKTSQKKDFPPTIKLIGINLNPEELYDKQQELIGTDWKQSNLFISDPTIDILGKNYLIEGVINQGGLAVAKSQGITINQNFSSQENKPVEETNVSQFEFTEMKTEEDGSADELLSDNLANAPKSFGVPISSAKLPKIDESPQPKKEKQHMDETVKKEPTQKKDTKHTPNKIIQWFSQHKRFAIGGFISGLLALLIIGFLFISLTGAAIISLNLNPKSINKDIVITLDPSIDETDFEEMVLKAGLVTKEFSFSQTNETTGVTLVGEKAEGKISITNKTDGVKTFPAGTNLTADGIRFTLNDDTTVASASVEIKQSEEVKTYGSSEARVTAVKIGAEANLENDTSLTIEDFSTDSYEARVIEPFSGGSSREIRVISEDDISQITLEVRKKILEIAAQEYKDDTNASKEMTYIPSGNSEILSQEFSGEVGDEAKTLSLDMSAEVEAVSYQNEDVKPLAEKVLSDLVPEGFEMVESDPQILSDVSSDDASGSAVTIDANISTKTIPILDYEQLKNEIASKPVSSAQSILESKSEVKSVSIELVPKILETIWKRLPRDLGKIEFKIDL